MSKLWENKKKQLQTLKNVQITQPRAGRGGWVLRISSNGDDRMGTEIETSNTPQGF